MPNSHPANSLRRLLRRPFRRWRAVNTSLVVVRFVAGFTAILFGAGLTGFGETATAKGSGGVYQVGVATDFPPYSFLDKDGLPAGYSVDLIRAVARQSRIPFEFIPGPATRVRKELKDGKLDAVMMMTHSTERDSYLDLTDPHITGHDAIFIRANQVERVQSEADLVNKRVIVLRNDLAADHFGSQRTARELVPVNSLNEGFKKLDAGEADALVCAQVAGLATLADLQLKEIREASQPLIQTYFREYGMAVQKGDAVLLDALNGGLRAVVASGEYAAIYDRWLSDVDPGVRPRAERHRRLLIGWTITIALLVVSFCLLLVFRREVKRQTRNLAASERRFRGLVENLPGAVYRCTRDAQWRIEFLSDEIEKISGYPAATFLDAKLLSLANLIHPDDAPTVWNHAANFRKKIGPYEIDFRILRQDGQIRWLHARGSSMCGTTGEIDYLDGILIDVSEQKRVSDLLTQQQSKMAQTARLSALGEMAGGIAHEINNPLAIINLRTHQLSQLADKGDVRAEDVRTIASGIESTAIRISKIIKSLQTVARESEHDPFEIVAVKTVIADAFELCLQRMRKHGIDVINDEIPETLAIEAKRVQISQVLINLLNNAFDAIQTLSERYIRISVLDLGSFVEIAITDSGRGIPRELSQKIFQPFFTTKGVGQGTGLGLSISKGLVEAHRGSITLDIDYPTTRFVINLPKRQVPLVKPTLGAPSAISPSTGRNHRGLHQGPHQGPSPLDL